ncbi:MULTISPECIES: helix-turn-helix transcriptional regulator [Streptomyces]|uniref:helix-turn-helix transcriptional regulator n=1 Tax=Streptomyces TaxID=1883 RepID=UPI0004C22EE2|nr:MULTISPECIES: LuxR family transcriptional regulator [Streptomyces]NEC43909.1 winged helix-turn-helix transcriptional regulator [Streptomyces sp. SID8016]QRV53899.1 winged helix-turn-helix transcriptional regulator [Streptomyces californicus]
MTGATAGRLASPPAERVALLAPDPPHLPLRGREEELARARRALEFGAEGGCVLVTVEGPPGCGRTRFLDECASLARRLGYVTGSRDGFGPADRPRLIVLDDPHLFAHEPGEVPLLRRYAPYGDRALVQLVARRPGAGPGGAEPLVVCPTGRTERIRLGTLHPPAALQVAADLLGAPPAAPLVRLLRGAGGHPKLLVELVEGLREEQLLRVGAHEAQLVEDRIPHRLRVLLQSMLLDLPDQCRHLLRVAAVLGRESTVDDLLTILQVPPSALLLVLDRMVSTGMLAVGSTRVRFPNELLWRLVVDSVPVPLRQALRRQAADGREDPRPVARPAPPAGPPDLNGQENRIVQLVAEGLTNKQMARRLGISPHTVNYHLKKLFQKTGVNSRIALLRETGWNDPSQESPEPGPRVRPRPGALEGGGQM